MRRHLYFAFAMLLFARIEAALACSRTDTPPTEEELFAKASTVFVGHLVRVEEAGAVSISELRAYAKLPPEVALESLPPIPAIEATFQVVEVFKGQPPADAKIRAPVGNYCSGPLLLAGSDHVFFLFEGNFVRSFDEVRPAFILPTWGNEEHVGPRLLEKLRQLSKSEPK
jgi:hypothetical protein